jgi:glutamate-1-semialdehyde 2,1-aminomutase
MVRFSNSGPRHDARGAAGASGDGRRIIKMEGGYHGLHDSALVSVKPKENEVGDPNAPNSVPGEGISHMIAKILPVAQFNDPASVNVCLRSTPTRSRRSL